MKTKIDCNKNYTCGARVVDADTVLIGGDTFKRNRKCVWYEDEYGSWDTGCGNKAILEDDGNHPAFCPWCGGTVVDQ